MLQTIALHRAAERSWLGLMLVALLTIVIHLVVPLTTDVSWLITLDERLLHGQRLYLDIIEPNPPMSAWLYYLPTWLADLSGLRPEWLVVLETTGLGVLSLCLTRRILAPVGLFSAGPAMWAAAAAVLLLPVSDFAQREHFALFGLLPCLAVSALRYAGRLPPRWAMIIAAIGGAFALSIKPHEALIIALPALVAAWHQRSWKPLLAPEHFIAGGLFLSYVGIVALTEPAFFTVMLPTAAAVYLPAGLSLKVLLLLPHALFVWLVLGAVLVAYRSRLPEPPLPTLLAATVGASLAYIVQDKGWAYHLLPGTALATILIAGTISAEGRLSAISRVIAIAFGCVAILPAALAIREPLAVPDPVATAMAKFGAGQKVGALVSDAAIVFPMLRDLGDTLVNSSPSLWRTTGAISLSRGADPARREVLRSYETADRDQLAHDLATKPPDLILAQDQPGIFDWLAWARQDPKIARFLDGYAPAEVVPWGPLMITILRRRPEGPPA